MADLNALYTQRAAQTPAAQAPGKAAPLSSANPLFAGPGTNFFDLLFTLQAAGAANTKPGDEKPLLPQAAILADPTLAATLPAEDADTQEELPDVFAGLLTPVDTSEQPRIFGNPSILSDRAAGLADQIDMQNRLIDNGVPALIATQLNPAQLKALNNLTDAQLQKLTPMDLVTLGVVPPGLMKQALLDKNIPAEHPITPVAPDAADAPDGAPTSLQDLAAKLNMLDVGGDAQTDDFTNVLRQMSAEGDATLPSDLDAASLRTMAKSAPANFADYLKGMNTLRLEGGAGLVGASMPDLLSPFQPLQGGMDNAFTLGGTGLNTQAQVQAIAKTNVASGAHPVTGVIAATLTKAANGAPRDITVQLNPPELGRVNVKVEVNKDKSLKAVLTIEKPETYLLLQKDQTALQQTLQTLGVATGGDLSFQLAHDGAFDRNPNQGGGGSHGARAGDDTHEAIEIDTGMRWFVDPETGLTRYNILA